MSTFNSADDDKKRISFCVRLLVCENTTDPIIMIIIIRNGSPTTGDTFTAQFCGLFPILLLYLIEEEEEEEEEEERCMRQSRKIWECPIENYSVECILASDDCAPAARVVGLSQSGAHLPSADSILRATARRYKSRRVSDRDAFLVRLSPTLVRARASAQAVRSTFRACPSRFPTFFFIWRSSVPFFLLYSSCETLVPLPLSRVYLWCGRNSHFLSETPSEHFFRYDSLNLPL
ncbi:hypothetical protein X777_16268 [Ooceraea biroi]|uniref:Uncharacterized protein n=1 Tax=Ooceraea biroi TaxID=2015173 RepID=A0A026VWZ0_OOCBI|nr:hypothetical protein X777_16268 [Ooceraea biroi]